MPDSRVRRVEPRDVTRVVELAHRLAAHEKAAHECHLTDDALRTALFGPERALFGHVAEVDGEVVGFALWFLNFSTWRGSHGIYLEDLFVTPDRRGEGLGRALLAALAELCVERGYARLEWSVLNWLEPTIAFYRSLGAVPMDGWTVFRLTGTPLAALGSAAASEEAGKAAPLPTGSS
ncbi:GNAT family N-acetyltransferase [Actinoalloteichus spitiensis]|uniref:GNAT family N-acetyltransferase n=1 Tax=Actinoalloteichus spitiensis TaxID=252394 RepID=UPI00036668A9|nr:GNAT family N-acetyltransferase [Actinoalloteichus spitiensis]